MKIFPLRLAPGLGVLAFGAMAVLLPMTPVKAQTVTKTPAAAMTGAHALSGKRLKALSFALAMYASDNNAYPAMKTPAALAKSLTPYLKGTPMGTTMFVEPGANTPYLTNPALSGKRTSQVKNPADVLAFYEAVPAADGSRLLCSADGRVLTVPGAKWAMVKRMLHIR